jgi:hypothetical protein
LGAAIATAAAASGSKPACENSTEQTGEHHVEFPKPPPGKTSIAPGQTNPPPK